MKRYYPTLKDIVYTALATIRNHPYITDPVVKSPVPDLNGNFPPIPIAKYRNFDGLELPEGGLTLSIFPRYSPNDAPFGGNTAADLEPATLGNKQQGAMYNVTYYIIINLAYQDVALGNNSQQVFVRNINKEFYTSQDKAKVREAVNDPFLQEGFFEVEVNPAEDILRDYVEVIRSILENIDFYVPWVLRGNSITSLNFPSSSWSTENRQIFFHQAFMTWEISTYAPTTYEPYSLVKSVEIKHANDALN